MNSFLRAASGLTLLASLASAQAFNVDVGAAVGAAGIPAATYAAAGLAGPWNNLDGSPNTTLTNLLDVNNNVTGVSVNISGGLANFFFDNPGTTGGDHALLDDLQDVGGLGGVATVAFTGLSNGKYTVRAYGWAPDARTTFTTTITVVGGSGPQTLGGAWTGTLVAGQHYRLDTTTVTGGTLSVQFATALGFGSVNGIQIELAGTPTTPFCTAKAGLVCGLPTISALGTSSAVATSGFTISSGPARSDKSGILLYNNGGVVPGVVFQGGTLCIPPMGLRRAGSTNSGGGAAPPPNCGPANCLGVFSVDMNSFAAGTWVVPDCSGGPSGIGSNNPAAFLLTPGTQVDCQYWGRDSVPTGSYVSSGLSYIVGP